MVDYTYSNTEAIYLPQIDNLNIKLSMLSIENSDLSSENLKFNEKKSWQAASSFLKCAHQRTFPFLFPNLFHNTPFSLHPIYYLRHQYSQSQQYRAGGQCREQRKFVVDKPNTSANCPKRSK